MSNLDVLTEFFDNVDRPRSCGAVYSSAYLQWKIHKQQLWRFDEFKAKDVAVPEFVPIPIKKFHSPDHKTPVRKGDSVVRDECVGLVLSVDREANEAIVYWHAPLNKQQGVDLDAFESNRSEKIRWRIETSKGDEEYWKKRFTENPPTFKLPWTEE